MPVMAPADTCARRGEALAARQPVTATYSKATGTATTRIQSPKRPMAHHCTSYENRIQIGYKRFETVIYSLRSAWPDQWIRSTCRPAKAGRYERYQGVRYEWVRYEAGWPALAWCGRLMATTATTATTVSVNRITTGARRLCPNS